MDNIKRYYREIWPREESAMVMDNLKELGVAYSMTNKGRTQVFYIDESETHKLPQDEAGFYLPTTEDMQSGKTMWEVIEN